MSSVGKSCGSMVKKLAGVATAYVSFRSVSSMLQESVENAKKAEEANTRLNTIMQQIPGITAEAKQATADYCKELSQQTTIGASAQKMGASQLASFQMSADSLNKLMPGLDKLAVAQYGVNVSSDQMIQAANLLGKAYSGQTGALSRAGIVMNETQAKLIKTGTETEKAAALVEILDQNFGDLAVQMANTNEGKIIQIKNAWESVKTEIGNALMPVVSDMVGYLRDHIPQIRDFIINAVDKAKPVLETALGAAKTAFQVVGDTIKWVADNLDWLEPIVIGVAGAYAAYQAVAVAVTAVQWALNVAMSANPIGIVVLAIGALIAAGVALYRNWDSVTAFFSNTWTKIKDGATQCWEGIKSVFAAVGGWVSTYIIQPIKGIFNKIYNVVEPIFTAFKTIFSKIWEIISTLFGVVAGWFNDNVVQPVVGVFKNIFSTVSNVFHSIWDTLVNIFSPVAEFFGNVFSTAWNMVTNAFSGVVGFFQGIWDKIKSMFTRIGSAIADGVSGAFKSVVNAVIGFAGKLINNFIRGINWAIDVINNIPGVNITKLAEVNLPMLAKGGIIRRAGDVIIGERGPEMLRLPQGAQVTPLPAGATAGGNTYQNTFYVEVNASDRGAAENFVKRVKEILDNM